jgi:hypothetical protein
MELAARLYAIREAAEKRIPPEARTIMRKHIDELRVSGIMNGVARVGQPAPEFTLPDGAGVSVTLRALRARGPVVLSFYRGRW